MTAVPDGQRSFQRFGQHDAEQRPGGVVLSFAATGTEAVEVDRAARSTANDDARQNGNVDVTCIQTPALQ